MLSINTNLSSIITQSSLTKATSGLNQAIERMSTGFKINHAKDNAANYSISTNLSTKISAYQVAEDNASMGLDMVTTANEALSIIETSLSRARALCVQAKNGTYGSDSLDAIKSELSSIIDELIRTKENTEFNGINLFGKEGMPVANPETGFIADVVTQTPDVTVSDPTKLLEAIENNSIIGISNAETLAELANIVNNDLHHCEGKTIVLTNDIDLSAYSNWTPIGRYDSADKEPHVFKGDFNGNGHTISNLTITSAAHNGVGLFGLQDGKVSNLGVENININVTKSNVGGIAGQGGVLSNCYTSGSIVVNTNGVGGLAGACMALYSYSTATVKGITQVGGLIGWGSAYGSYATGDVTGTGQQIGGLIGTADRGITNCYATGEVIGASRTGGLIGMVNTNYSTKTLANIENCYATGDVTGSDMVGGLIGMSYNNVAVVTNSYSTGTVTGSGADVSDFVGNTVICADEISKKITIDELNQYLSPNGIFSSTNSNLQIGINSDTNSSLNVDFCLKTPELMLLKNRIGSSYTLNLVDEMLSKISAKQTELGAATNRLESALEEISIQYENLVSTRSTICDADIAEESSAYIQKQILQQASATLLATANQTPAIALQLI